MDDVTTLLARAERAEQELAQLRELVAIRERDTVPPGSDEPTGQMHPDPLAEICVSVDQLKDAVVGRLKGLEATVASMQNWKPQWVDDILAFAEQARKLEGRVVQLEAFRTLRLEACKDCGRLQALGGE